MIRLTFAAAIAALVFAALPAAQAAPMAPLPAGIASDAANGHVTQVWYHHHHWCRWHPHRC